MTTIQFMNFLILLFCLVVYLIAYKLIVGLRVFFFVILTWVVHGIFYYIVVEINPNIGFLHEWSQVLRFQEIILFTAIGLTLIALHRKGMLK